MDIATRLSGVFIDDPGADRASGYEDRSYVGNRREREERAAARADDRAIRDGSVFDGVTRDLDAGSNTPGSVAYMYPSAIAEVKSLVAGGHFEEANSVLQGLRRSADDNNAVYRTYASTTPKTDFERQVAEGGFRMSTYSFWDEQLRLPDGSVRTAGDMFRDGQAYKDYAYGSRLQRGMSKEFVDDYRNTEDPARRSAMALVADPVSAGNVTGKALVEYNYIGEYVRANWDDMVGELGEAGATLLVRDAVSNRLMSGTGVDTMDSVRRFARSRAASGDAVSGQDTVRQFLGQIDRGLSSVSGGSDKVDDRARRGYAKLVNSLADSSVNLDDPVVKDRIASLWRVYQVADAYGVSLLTEGNEGGQDMRAAMADYVTSDTESNFVRRVGNFLGLAGQVVSDDDKSPKAVAGIATGLRGDLVRAGVKAMSTGAREDFVLQDIVAKPVQALGLVSDWASTLAATGGFSRDASTYLAGKMIDAMSSGGGVRTFSPGEVITSASFDEGCPSEIRRELRQWYKGNGMVSGVLEPLKADYVSMMMDDTIGPGLDATRAGAMWSWVLGKAAAQMERGGDPSSSIRTLSSTFPVYRPTGLWILPGVSRMLTSKEYAEVSRKVASAVGVARVDDVEVDRKALSLARPYVTRSAAPEDLRTVTVPGIPEIGIDGGFGPGDWNDPSKRTAFLSYMALLKGMYRDNQEELLKAASKEDKMR